MAGQLVALRHATVAEAAEAFLARTMPGTTRRSYAQTMSRLVAAHGGLPLAALRGAGDRRRRHAQDGPLTGPGGRVKVLAESDAKFPVGVVGFRGW
jgi:hypothetical protein